MSTITGTLTVSGTTVTGTLTVDETVVNGTLGVITGGGGVGVPVGGTTAQALVKASDADYDTVWATPAGGGDALVANPLSQFAATTKAELNGVISDGTPMYVGDAPTAHTHVVANVTDFDAGVAVSPAVTANTAKVSNVDHPLVETAVPIGAVFTDTVYDDTAIQAEVTANTAKVSNVDHPLVETAVPVGAVFTDTVYNDAAIQSEVDLNTAKVGVTTEIKPTDIDTLAELNAIVTDATLIDTTDARLSDARTPTAHTHVASEITDFDAEVSNNAAVAANTAKVGVTVEEQNPDLISQAEAEAGTATTERTFSALRVAQAIAALGGGGGGGGGGVGGVTLPPVYKTVDETRIGTNTPAIDGELQIALEANSVYTFKVLIFHASESIPDTRLTMTYDATFSKGDFGHRLDSIEGILFPLNTVFDAAGSGGNIKSCNFIGVINTTTAGNIGLAWSQVSVSGSATVLKAGSKLEVTKIN